MTKFKVALLARVSGQPAEPCLLAVAPRSTRPGPGAKPRSLLQEAERLLLNAKPDPARWRALGPWCHLIP